MEQHNIDSQIKEKLKAREIQPSDQTWNRLDALLTISEEKREKKGYGWYFVAASTILFFGLGFFLFNSNKTTAINNSIPIRTTVNEEIDTVESPKINKISVEKEQPVLVQNETNFSKTKKNKKSEGIKELIKGENVIDEKIASNSQLPTPNTYKYISPEKLLADVQTTEKINPSDKKTIDKPRVKIDATSLLTHVEKELDETHKETTLDKLSKKIQDAKSALVNRNYE
jgi:hypothetical protein